MKVAQVSPRYSPDIGGVEAHVQEISNRLAARGDDVEVLTTDPTGRLAEKEVVGQVKVRRFKSWAPSDSYFVSGKLKRFLVERSNDYDIVHAHSYHALPALYAAKAKGKNLLVLTPHYHGTGHTFFRSLLHFPWRYYSRQMLTQADRIVCVSSYEKDQVLRRFGELEPKITVIPNGLNVKEFETLDKGKAVDLRFKKILCVSRLEKYKRIGLVLEALPNLDDSFHLDIVGKGPEMSGLQNLARRKGVAERVSFFQDLDREELLRMYSEAVVFVALSRHEAFGLTVAEALAAGTPCLVAPFSALGEWVDGRTCFGYAGDDPSTLAQQIEQTSKITIGKRYSEDWDEVVERLRQLYEVLRIKSP